jgi:hypothetical protein
MRIFEELFNDSEPKSCTHTLEKCLAETHRVVRSTVLNLRLGSIGFESQYGDIMTMCMSDSTSSHKMMMKA